MSLFGTWLETGLLNESSNPRKPPWRAGALLAACLVVLAAALYLPWLGYTDMVHEETRKAVIARNMMDSGDYLVPHLADRVYLSKPPLFNWLIAATSLPGGTVTEFTARLPSVITLALTALLMVFTAGRRLGPGGRWLLGLSILVAGQMMRVATLAVTENTFMLLVSASLWLWYELDDRGRRGLALWLPPALLVVAAYLAKREPALIFYYLGIGAFLLTQRRFKELFSAGHLIAAAVTVGLIGLWLGAVLDRVGLEAWLANFNHQVLQRDLSTHWLQYLIQFFRYPGDLLLGAAPLSLLLLPLAWRSVRRALHERYGRLYVFAIVVTLVNLPIYWFRSETEVRYFQPMFPTALVLAAMMFETYIRAPERLSRGVHGLARATAHFLLLLSTILAALLVLLSIPGLFPRIAGPITPPAFTMALGGAALAGIGYLVARRRRETAVLLFAATVGFGMLFRIGEITYHIPHEKERIVRQHDDVPAILAHIRGELPAGVDHVQALGSIPHAVWFYDRTGTVVPDARYDRRGQLASPYLLVHIDNRRLLERMPFPVTVIERIPYQDGDFLLARAGRPPAPNTAENK